MQEANGRMTALSGDAIEYNRREVVHGVLVAAGQRSTCAHCRAFPRSPAALNSVEIRATSHPVHARDIAYRSCLPGISLGKTIMPDSAPQQLLHLVIGGELTDLEHTTFKDLDQVEIVGVYPNYASALRGLEGEGAADRGQRPHALLRGSPPPAARSRSRHEVLWLRSPAVETLPSRLAAQRLGSARAGGARGRISAAGLADQPLQLRAGRRL